MIEIVLHGEKLTEVAGFTITNAMVYSWFVTALLVAGAFAVSKKTAMIPARMQGMIEVILGGTTGRVTAPHLHWEVVWKGNPANPFHFLQALAQTDGPK
jgi:F0F1-type ATP synthase membrane subunit a